MKIFGIKIQTKKELKQEVANLQDLLFDADDELDEYEATLGYIATKFPFDLDVEVYEVQLKNKNGKFTSTKPSKEHSVIVPVVVTEKNYFRLAKKYENGVFLEQDEAEAYLDELCGVNESTEA